jgi:hypothetical protein
MHFHADGHRYELKARELRKKNAVETRWPIAVGLRLPQPEDDPSNNPLLAQYLPLATVIELRPTPDMDPDAAAPSCRCELGSIGLLRMKL